MGALHTAAVRVLGACTQASNTPLLPTTTQASEAECQACQQQHKPQHGANDDAGDSSLRELRRHAAVTKKKLPGAVSSPGAGSAGCLVALACSRVAPGVQLAGPCSQQAVCMRADSSQPAAWSNRRTPSQDSTPLANPTPVQTLLMTPCGAGNGPGVSRVALAIASGRCKTHHKAKRSLQQYKQPSVMTATLPSGDVCCAAAELELHGRVLHKTIRASALAAEDQSFTIHVRHVDGLCRRHAWRKFTLFAPLCPVGAASIACQVPQNMQSVAVINYGAEASSRRVCRHAAACACLPAPL
jgi:hypothetical protein